MHQNVPTSESDTRDILVPAEALQTAIEEDSRSAGVYVGSASIQGLI